MRLSGLQVLNSLNVQSVAKEWNVKFKKIHLMDIALANLWSVWKKLLFEVVLMLIDESASNSLKVSILVITLA